MKKTACILGAIISVPAFAGDDCLPYKMTPMINVTAPAWTKSVVQPLRPMDLLHGDVVATLVDNYDVVADITSIEDGICVSLKAVDATVGYDDFMVQIDSRHSPNTCAYDAILAHEDEHIRAYLSVIDDLMGDIYESISSAANTVMPVFVRDESQMDAAIDELNARLQSHPDVILIKQKISAAQEIRNKRVDQHDDGAALKRCLGL